MIAIDGYELGFKNRWIDYCEANQIPYKIVDCYQSNIIDQIKDCDAIMWHFHNTDYRNHIFAKSLLFSLQASGKKVFPDFNTCWHFDDKVSQKYLLESLNLPLVPTYTFYSKDKALNWANETSFPKVFKLTSGAGSTNVLLVENKTKAKKLIHIAFSQGFIPSRKSHILKERIRKYREKKIPFISFIKGLGRLIIPTTFMKMAKVEKGYVYFQEFIPKNEFDIRVIVIGGKAFAIKRNVRKNDFRASGSGYIEYSKDVIPLECVKLAFESNDKLKSQCVGFDFVFDISGNPLIVEISYGFNAPGYDGCPGYWTKELEWIEGRFIPQNWMVEELLGLKTKSS